MTIKQSLKRSGVLGVVVAAIAIATMVTADFGMAQSASFSDTGISATAQGPLGSSGVYSVAKGDSLYGISRRFGLSVDRLRALNGLSGTAIFEGQRLRIGTPPSLEGSGATSNTTLAALTPVGAKTHTVQRGDTAYRIARNAGISLDTLVRLNSLDTNYTLVVGQILVLGQGDSQSALTTSRVTPAPTASTLLAGPVVLEPVGSGNGALPEVLDWAASPNAPTPLAVAPQPSVDDWTQSVPLTNASASTANTTSIQLSRRRLEDTQIETRGEEKLFLPSSPSADNGERRFTWPVRGRLLSSFGPRDGGLVNDGVNIAVRTGEAVKAAAAGKVIYASDEMDAFGNLVLVEHADGWVTAYAHNERLTVNKGQRVQQGQTIARAGSSGTVDRSQLHFEVRQNGKPVNPMSVLKF